MLSFYFGVGPNGVGSSIGLLRCNASSFYLVNRLLSSCHNRYLVDRILRNFYSNEANSLISYVYIKHISIEQFDKETFVQKIVVFLQLDRPIEASLKILYNTLLFFDKQFGKQSNYAYIVSIKSS